MKVMDGGMQDCKFTDPHYSLLRLHEILSGGLGETPAEWHVRIINQYLKSLSQEGIPAEDLHYLIFILETLSKRVEDISEYKAPFAELLRKSCSVTETLAISFLKGNFDVHILEKYFSFVGCLLVTIFDYDLQKTVIDIIEYWISISYSASSNCTTGYLCQFAMERSCLPLTLSRALDIVNMEAYSKLLNIAFQIVKGSPDCCEILASMGVINVVLMRLNVNNTSLENFPRTEKIHVESVNSRREEISLMNLSVSFLIAILCAVKGTDTLAKDTGAPTRKALCNLRYLLREFLSRNPTERNYAFTLLLLILTSFPKLKIVESGLVEDIAVLAASPELDMASSKDDDAELKKIVLFCSCHCCKYLAALKIFKAHKLVSAMINFVTMFNNKSVVDTQLWDMTLIVLDTLNQTVPVLSEDFIDCKGSNVLLAIINNFLEKSCEPAVLCKCMKILHTVVEVDPLLSDLRNRGGIRIINNVCEHILNHFHLTQIFQKILMYGFYILEKLTNNNDPDKDMISIDLILNMIKRIVKPDIRDSCLDNRLLICLYNFIWTYVVGNPTLMKYFANNGGVYAILDTFTICIRPVKLLLLSIIVDMCDEGTMLQHLLTWRNGKSKKEFLIKMLVNLWKEEERLLKVKRRDNSVIEDIEYPLMGEEQRISISNLSKTSMSSPAIVDTVGSMRPKIYAVIQLLSRYSDVKKVILEQYGLLYLELESEEKVLLEVIKNYLAFKLSEVWNEVLRSVNASRLESIRVDRNLLETLNEKFPKWATAVQNSQLSIIKQAEDKELEEETNLYALLKEARLADSLQALRELELIARTTDNEFRLKRKQMQNYQINRSRASLNLDDKHAKKTYNENIKVT